MFPQNILLFCDYSSVGVHLDKWLHVNRGKIDLRDRQLVLQQVVNILAAVHTNGNEDKLCLWGSFVGKYNVYSATHPINYTSNRAHLLYSAHHFGPTLHALSC